VFQFIFPADGAVLADVVDDSLEAATLKGCLAARDEGVTNVDGLSADPMGRDRDRSAPRL